MNRIFLSIFLAFLLSLLIHYLLFVGINRNIKNEKLTFPTTNKKQTSQKNGFTNLKFVKVKKTTPQKKNPKPIVKKEKIKKPVEKKKIVKEIKKKTPKKIVKNVLKKTLNKNIKTIQLPKKEEVVNLKELFTLSDKQIIKENEQEIKRQEKAIEKYKEEQSIQKTDKLTQSYIKLYGEQYYAFSQTQKNFIKNNIGKIGTITQRYLEYPMISIRTKQSGINVVEFTLYPNGDIKDLNLKDGSHYTALDQNSVNTIKIAYKDYPKPLEPVKIIIYINYILN